VTRKSQKWFIRYCAKTVNVVYIGETGRPLAARVTSGYATWFTARGAIRNSHYDVIDDVITRKL